ncbi:MAG: SDR family NAD(P)-dependent oxidoreductase [Candidatus Aenigmatarchaeota archaeon]
MINLKILVTGGAGFIGSHLVDRLIKEGNEIIILDNMSTGKKENVSSQAKLIKGDIRSEADVKKAMKDCEYVFHLAAQADVSADEDMNFQVNFTGSKNVFDIAKDSGAKIIFTSSAAVYGNTKIPHSENAVCKPISHYGKNKLKAERLLNSESFIIRCFNVYGMRGHGVINKFCKKIPEYEDITIYGNGLQTRDFIHVNDIVDALILGMDKNGTYNIGTGRETSILQLIDIISRMTKSKAHTKHAMPNKNEITRSKADITAIKKFGWQPKLSLEQGIKTLLNEIGIKTGIY